MSDIDNLRDLMRGPRAEKTFEVKIGNQIWMTRNLNVSSYRNGDPIPQVKYDEWDKLKTGAWCYYKNGSSLGLIYGKLYNWHAVHDPRGLAPQGWHVPTHAEWMTLVNASGPSPLTRAGIYLKEAGTKHWNDPNLADNRTGFTALPGGARGIPNSSGARRYRFVELGIIGYFWASDIYNSSDRLNGLPWSIYFIHNTGSFSDWPMPKHYGYSVRLIKD